MTKTSMRTHVLFFDQLQRIPLPRSWSPGMELDCSGRILLWTIVCSLHAHHLDAVVAQSKEEKMIARQGDRMVGGRGVLAEIIGTNLDRATGRGCQISPVSGSGVLVEGQRQVVSPPCVRPCPFGQAHTQTQQTQTRSG